MLEKLKDAQDKQALIDEVSEANNFYKNLKPIEELQEPDLIPVTVYCQKDLEIKLNALRKPFHQDIMNDELSNFRKTFISAVQSVANVESRPDQPMTQDQKKKYINEVKNASTILQPNGSIKQKKKKVQSQGFSPSTTLYTKNQNQTDADGVFSDYETPVVMKKLISPEKNQSQRVRFQDSDDKVLQKIMQRSLTRKISRSHTQLAQLGTKLMRRKTELVEEKVPKVIKKWKPEPPDSLQIIRGRMKYILKSPERVSDEDRGQFFKIIDVGKPKEILSKSPSQIKEELSKSFSKLNISNDIRSSRQRIFDKGVENLHRPSVASILLEQLLEYDKQNTTGINSMDFSLTSNPNLRKLTEEQIIMQTKSSDQSPEISSISRNTKLLSAHSTEKPLNPLRTNYGKSFNSDSRNRTQYTMNFKQNQSMYKIKSQRGGTQTSSIMEEGFSQKPAMEDRYKQLSKKYFNKQLQPRKRATEKEKVEDEMRRSMFHNLVDTCNEESKHTRLNISLVDQQSLAIQQKVGNIQDMIVNKQQLSNDYQKDAMKSYKHQKSGKTFMYTEGRMIASQHDWITQSDKIIQMSNDTVSRDKKSIEKLYKQSLINNFKEESDEDEEYQKMLKQYKKGADSKFGKIQKNQMSHETMINLEKHSLETITSESGIGGQM